MELVKNIKEEDLAYYAYNIWCLGLSLDEFIDIEYISRREFIKLRQNGDKFYLKF